MYEPTCLSLGCQSSATLSSTTQSHNQSWPFWSQPKTPFCYPDRSTIPLTYSSSTPLSSCLTLMGTKPALLLGTTGQGRRLGICNNIFVRHLAPEGLIGNTSPSSMPLVWRCAATTKGPNPPSDANFKPVIGPLEILVPNSVLASDRNLRVKLAENVVSFESSKVS